MPILCTTDCSWPILKCLSEGFNGESLEEYTSRSYKVASGDALSNDLPTRPNKSFFHISLCQSMKAFAKKVNHYFTRERDFIKFVMSLLANAGNIRDIFLIVRNLFAVLLSKTRAECDKEKGI